MEDKRKKELKEKIDKINDLKATINAVKELVEDAMDTLEFLKSFQCHCISFAGYSDNEGYKEDVPIRLHDKDMEEVQELIKKKLRSEIGEYKDEISEAYQELDRLLK